METCSMASLSGRNVSLPYSYLDPAQQPGSALRLILGHGLGAKNPASTGHEGDEWIKLVGNSALSSSSGLLAPVLYTARGHKGSTGWEASSEAGDIGQFTWENLSDDMFSLAHDYLKLDEFVVGGSSMGSATALYCVIKNPARHFRGLVLVRPPTAWETRRERRKFLVGSARKCEQRAIDKPDATPQEKAAHLVLLGAADADLPDPDPSLGGARVEETYGRITCPTLILAVRGDGAHPLETAARLHVLIAHSELFVADSLDEARQAWPAIVAAWAARL